MHEKVKIEWKRVIKLFWENSRGGGDRERKWIMKVRI